MGDIDDIKQVKYRYLRALDTKNWDEFADTLTEDVSGDYGASLGEEHRFTDRDSLVKFMRTSLGPEFITEHRVTHPEITLDGDEASATWCLQHRVIAPDFNFMLIGDAFDVYLAIAINAPGCSHRIICTKVASSIATQPAVGPPSVACRKNAPPLPGTRALFTPMTTACTY
jgi:hypothetical protein